MRKCSREEFSTTPANSIPESRSSENIDDYPSSARSLEPVDCSYHQLIENIKKKHEIARHLTLYEYIDKRHFFAGCYSHVFVAKREGHTVVIKMLKQQLLDRDIGEQQIRREVDILSVVNHKHIIKINASGWIPRPFIEVEYLGGGTLEQFLTKHATRNQPLPLQVSLRMVKELAAAVKYLHEECSPDVSIIHRGR